ncbi:hypothetical protein NKH77_06600 [Streptomyces sp. M19]
MTTVSKEQPPTREPFARVPAELVRLLRPFLDGVADEVARAVRREVPEYAVALDPLRSKPRSRAYGGPWSCCWTGWRGRARAARRSPPPTTRSGGPPPRRAAVWTACGRCCGWPPGSPGGGCAPWPTPGAPRSALAVLGEAGLVHFDELTAAASAGHAEARLRSNDEPGCAAAGCWSC